MLIATDVWRGRSASQSVCHADVSCKNGWTDRDARPPEHVSSGGPPGVGNSNHVLDGGPYLPEKEAY